MPPIRDDATLSSATEDASKSDIAVISRINHHTAASGESDDTTAEIGLSRNVENIQSLSDQLAHDEIADVDKNESNRKHINWSSVLASLQVGFPLFVGEILAPSIHAHIRLVCAQREKPLAVARKEEYCTNRSLFFFTKSSKIRSCPICLDPIVPDLCG